MAGECRAGSSSSHQPMLGVVDAVGTPTAMAPRVEALGGRPVLRIL